MNGSIRLAHSVSHEWRSRHELQSRGVTDPEHGACTYSQEEHLHFEYCAQYWPLPVMEVSYDSRLQIRNLGFDGQRVEARHRGNIFSAEHDASVSFPRHHGHSARTRYLIDYGDHPAGSTRGRGSQSCRFDRDSDDQYGESLGIGGRRSVNVDHAGESDNAYSPHRSSRLDNNDLEYTDEFENYSSRSKLSLSRGSHREDEFAGADGGRGFDSSGSGGHPREPLVMNGGSGSTSSSGQLLGPDFASDDHEARPGGLRSRRHGGGVATASNDRGGEARGGRDGASAREAMTCTARGAREGLASLLSTRRGDRTRSVVTHAAREPRRSTIGAAELDSNPLFELAPGTTTKQADAATTHSRRRSSKEAAQLDSNPLFELAPGTTTEHADATTTRSRRRVHF